MPNPADIDITGDIADGSIDGVVSAHADSVPADRGSDTPVEPKAAEPAAEPTAKVNLRDQISSALKGEEATPANAQQDGRPRNPDGTFATAPQDTPAVEPVQQQATVNVPQGLPPQLAPHFSALPAELQQHVATTMEAVNTQAVRYAAFEQIIAPRYQAWALNGMTPEGAINQLLALSDFAGRDPAGFVKYFAQQQQLNLEDIAFGPEPVDPQIAALQQQLQQVTGQLNQQQQSVQQQQYEATVNQIATAIEAKDDKGEYLYPHIEELGEGFLPYIQLVRQQQPNASIPDTIKVAYDQACWANPSIRQKLQQAQQQQAQSRQLAENVETARKAKKAGVSVASGAPTASAATANSGSKSLRDSIKDAVAAAS